MSYTKTVWMSGDVITSDGLNNLEAGIEDAVSAVDQVSAEHKCITESMNQISTTAGENTQAIAALKEELSALQSQVPDSFAVTARLDKLEQLIEALRKDDATQVAISTETTEVNEPDKRVVLSSSQGNAQKMSVQAKAIWAEDLKLDSCHTALTASESLTLKDATTSGTLEKQVANAAWSLNTNGTVEISGGKFAQTGYNNIEIGLANTSPKEVTIKDANFSGTLSNNTVLIFDTADNAVVTIKNCHFGPCSNAIRLSNRSNVHFTLNIENCTFDAFDQNLEYTGLLILQDYTSESLEEVKSSDRFSKDKITVNILNCTGPQSKKISTPEDLATIVGTKDKNQLIYAYNSFEGVVPYTGNESRYPTIKITQKIKL